MTEDEFYQSALLQIASNSAFGNGKHSYIDYGYWSEKIHEAARSLLWKAKQHSKFDVPDKPP